MCPRLFGRLFDAVHISDRTLPSNRISVPQIDPQAGKVNWPHQPGVSAMRQTRQLAILVLTYLAAVGCQGPMDVRLDNSIGLAMYENLGMIEQKPIGIGLVISDDLRQATTEVVAGDIRFKMAVGETIASRLMYAMVLQFDRVRLLQDDPLLSVLALPESSQLDRALDAVLFVNLKHLDSIVSISRKWNTVAIESAGWIEIEARLEDRRGLYIWSGTGLGLAEAEATEESIGFAGGQDASVAMNRAIESMVARLVAQMSMSESLHDFIDEVEPDGSLYLLSVRKSL